MSGFFIILAMAFVITIIRAHNESRLIDADWMANEDKFHHIARWGA